MPIMLQAVHTAGRWTERYLRSLFVSIILLQGCTIPFLDRCDDQITREAASDDDKFIATLYVRNCGATTDYSSIVSLREKTSEFDGDADANIIFVAKGRQTIGFNWVSPNEIRVQCNTCVSGDIFKHEHSWKTVQISY